jgi:hypothetical protein
MKKRLWAIMLAGAAMSFSSGCKKELPLNEAIDRIRAFAEESNPELKDQPLMVTMSRRKGGGGDVCACIKVCSASGKCTACSCSPPRCTTCASAAELAPVDSVFEAPVR